MYAIINPEPTPSHQNVTICLHFIRHKVFKNPQICYLGCNMILKGLCVCFQASQNYKLIFIWFSSPLIIHRSQTILELLDGGERVCVYTNNSVYPVYHSLKLDAGLRNVRLRIRIEGDDTHRQRDNIYIISLGLVVGILVPVFCPLGRTRRGKGEWSV